MWCAILGAATRCRMCFSLWRQIVLVKRVTSSGKSFHAHPAPQLVEPQSGKRITWTARTVVRKTNKFAVYAFRQGAVFQWYQATIGEIFEEKMYIKILFGPNNDWTNILIHPAVQQAEMDWWGRPCCRQSPLICLGQWSRPGWPLRCFGNGGQSGKGFDSTGNEPCRCGWTPYGEIDLTIIA